jgi:exopolyphosphatase / guanosine-5'-triphosphate,3'-diphosphate pyrophosphatase
VTEACSADSSPLAVVDIGSNSARMVVFRFGERGHLEVLEDARAPLRLGRSLTRGSELGPDAVERTLDALRDFRAVAIGAGAGHTIAVATSAVRDASDGPVLVERAREEAGFDIRTIGGDAEGVLAFLGAVHDLPVSDGIVMDEGGGSMELTRFADRAPVESWTLPLGSLRLSDEHLSSDPPTDKELQRVRKAVERALKEAGVPSLLPGEVLVGVGGTVRNLARIDRRRTDYPLPLLHGHVVSVEGLQEMVDLLASRKMGRRATTPGLNPDRADTIVGGGLAVLVVMRALSAERLVASSRGLREGVALRELSEELPSARLVREGSVRSLARRFATWDAEVAARRARIAGRLVESLEPETSPTRREMLAHAATLVDTGRAIDYYERFEHAAMLVTASDLGGFSHRDLGLLTAILQLAGDDRRLGPTRSLLDAEEREWVRQAAAVLTLADELNRRIRPDSAAEISCGWRRDGFAVAAPIPHAWAPRAAGERFAQVFGRPLLVESAQGRL